MSRTCVWVFGSTLVWCVSVLHGASVQHLESGLQSNFHGTSQKNQNPGFASGNGHHEMLSWAVHLNLDTSEFTKKEIDLIADVVAVETGLVNHGQIGSLAGHYLFVHNLHHLSVKQKQPLVFPKNALEDDHVIWGNQTFTKQDWHRLRQLAQESLDSHGHVHWHMQQVVRPRQKRGMSFRDPAYVNQWHLHNDYVDWSGKSKKGYDINVEKVWKKNITGKGIITAVVDDGLQWNNKDIAANYCPEASWDLNDDDSDPMPNPQSSKENHHGTRCGGEIAAVANDVCGVGVAYEAKLAGIKILDGPMTDSLEATAFTKSNDLVHVYSCSWGPDDDGKTVDGPHYLALSGLRHAVDYGRDGYGSIFVVASGNGGRHNDNCNFDGYANSIYTVTIGAVDEFGSMPYYGEECASMLAVTFSSGDSFRGITTTDWTFRGGTGCTDQHSGTSAAAPLAAGMIALMLEAQPCLTWRDIQHIIVMAAVKMDLDAVWSQNTAGLHHSHQHGFGLMDAWRLVNAAKAWEPVPWMTIYSTEEMLVNMQIPPTGEELKIVYEATAEKLAGYSLFSLEYVHVTVTVDHERRGDLDIQLLCSSGTDSIMAAPRSLDDSSEGFQAWTFGTVRCWGESPEGNWTLIIKDIGDNMERSRGILRWWQLKLFGSPMTTQDVQDRLKVLEEAANTGEPLREGYTAPCPPPPLRNKRTNLLSEKTMKILALSGIFILFLTFYETFEYMFCYDDEKTEHQQKMLLTMRARELAEGNLAGDESTDLLSAEEIPLQTFSRSDGRSDGYQSLVGSDEVGSPQDGSYQAGPCSSGEHLHSPMQDIDIPGASNETSFNEQNIGQNRDIPQELLNSLSPAELRLNLGMGLPKR